MSVPIKVPAGPKRCGTCQRIRNAIPMPQRLRGALEDLEQRRLAAKEAKRLRKAAKVREP